MRDTRPDPLVQVEDLKMHFPIYTGVFRRHTGDVKAASAAQCRATLGGCECLRWLSRGACASPPDASRPRAGAGATPAWITCSSQ